MSYVRRYYGPAGTPGTDGVNPRDNGTDGGYAAPIGILNFDPAKGIRVIGGAGGAGGSGATFANAGAGGNGGYAGATTTVALDSVNDLVGYAAAVGGAGGDSGQYSFPGYGADGGAGGNASANASSANALGLARAEADAFGGAGGRGQNGAFSGNGGGARASAYAAGLYASANVYQRGGRGGDGINGGAGGTGAASTLTNAVSGNGLEYLKLSQTAVGGAGGAAAFGAPTGFGGAASSKLTFSDSVAPTFFGRSAAYGGAGGGGTRGSFSQEGASGYASIALTGQNFVDASAYATGGAGGGAYVPGGVNYAGFGAPGGEATGAHASVVAQGTAYARAVGTGGAGGSAYGAGEIAGDGGVAFGETAYASGSSAFDTVTQTGGAGGNGYYGASGGTGQGSLLVNAVSAKGDFLQLQQTAVGGAGGGSYLGTAGHGGTGFSGFIFDDSVNALRASSIYGKSTARGGAGGEGGGGSNGAVGGNAFAAARVTGRTSIRAHALAVGGSGGAAEYAGSGGAGGIAYGAHATAIAVAPIGGASYAGTEEDGGRGGSGNGLGHAGGAGGAVGGSLAYASGYSASVVVIQAGGAGGAGNGFANGGAGGSTTITNAAKGRSTGGYVKLFQTAAGGAGGSSDGGAGGIGGSASSALGFDDTTNPVAASSVYGKSTATGGAGGDSSFSTANGGGGGAASASVSLKGTNTVDARAYAYGGAGGRGLELGEYGGAGGVATGVTAYGSGYAVQVTALQRGGAGGGGYSRGGAGADSVLTNAVSGRTSGGYLTLNQTAIGGAGGYSEENSAGTGGGAESVFSFDDTTNPTPAIVLTGKSTAIGGAGGTGKYSANGGAGGSAFARAVVVGTGETSARALATGGAGGAAGHEVANGGAGGAVTGAQAIMAQAAGIGYARADETGGAGGKGYGPGYAGGAGGAATGSLAFGAGFSATVELYQTGGAGGSGMAGAAGGAGGDSKVVGSTSGPVSIGTHGNPPAEGVSGATTGGFLDLSQTATGGAGGYSNRSAGGVGGRALSSFSFDDTRNAVAASSIYGRNQAVGGAGGSTASGVNTGGAGGAASGVVGVKGSHTVTAADYVYGGVGGDGGIGGSGGAATGAQASAISTATIGRTYARSIETGGMGGTGFGPGNRLGAHGGAGGAASGSSAFAAGYSAVAVVQQTGGAGGIGLSEASGGAGGSSTLTSAVSGQSGGGYLELFQTATGGAGGDSHGADGGRGGLASSSLTFDDTANLTASSFIKGVSAAYGGKGGKSFVDFSNGAGNGGVGAGASATIDLTGTDIVKTYADAVGGAGGVGYGGGHSGGNGGTASASHSFASGHSARAAAYQRGGSGGGGSGGANGGAGAASILSNAVSGQTTGGYLTLNQVAVAGAGGYSIDGTAGAGGAARSTFSFDDGFSPIAASSLYGRGIARGGAGGNGSYGGAGGGAAYVSVDVTGPHSVKALAGAYGGAGGQALLGGIGGAGGAASAYAVSDTVGSDTTALAKVTGGLGGNGATGGAGGAATGATAKARDGSLSAGTKAYAKSTETAGAGGSGSGSGQSGGSGAAASGSTAFASGFSAQALVYQTGGAGGRGTNGANGGAGGDSALTEAAIGYALGGYLNLLQMATGGRGGDTDGGLAGKGGSASSALAFAYFDHGGNPVASKLTGRSFAAGGAGGSLYLGASIYGPVTGGAGGSASATADLYLVGSSVVGVDADSTGGAGGFGYGAGRSGGAGGVAQDTRASAGGGQSAVVSAEQIGGAGGRGLDGAAGGVGADSTLNNAVSGRTTGGYLKLSQTAIGGDGGLSYGGAGGAGGSAYSNFKFDDTTANTVQASSLYGRSAALGGAGGNGYTVAGTGGAATAKVNLKGASSVSAVGYARGGQGGSADAGGGAAGGSALAQAYSYATSLGAAGTATAQATAFGGAGSTPGAARALSQAATSNGQLAQAISIAQGGGYGIANAVAFAYGSGIVRSAGALGFAQLGGPGAVVAIGEADAGTPFGFDNGSHNSYSFATALPSSSYVASALQGHANVGSLLGASGASVFGAATQGAANPLQASGQQEFQGTTGWVLDGSQLTGDIIIGLLGTQTLGSGFNSLSFFIDVSGSQDFDESFSFTSLGAARTFFTDHALDIGHFTSAPGVPVTVSISFDLFTSSPGSSFGFDYLLGQGHDTTPPVLNPVADQVDEATSAAGAVAMFTATATDAVDGAVPVVFTEGNTVVHSGDTFSLGTHTITANATDAAGNTSSEQFTIKVLDTSAPVLSPVANQNDAATSAAGVVASFAANATDAVDGTDPVVFTEGNTVVHSGDTFSLGTHTITASATDAAGNTSSEQFTIKVTDTPPVLSPVADQVDEATSAAGAVVSFAATATDAVDGTDPVVFTEGNTVLRSGDTFSLGTHTITASATDVAGNTSSEQFTIKVVDTTGPVLSPVANQTDEATSPAGAVASFAVTATDAVDGADPVVFTEGNTVVHSGDTFSLGTHTITASATDAAGNTSSEQFTIKVADTIAPVLSPVADQTDEQTSAAGAVASFAATATDTVDGADPVVFTEGNTVVHSGDTFSLGTHTITASATDAAGNTGFEQFTIKVVAQAPPVTTVPGDQLVQQGMNTPIAGISVADADADTAGETITVVLSDATGVLAATGTGVSSPGTTLTISGSLTDVNNELGTLTLLEGGPGSDTIDVATSDGRGGSDDHKIAVSINSPVVVAVVISAPASPKEGVAFDGEVATFTSSNPSDVVSSFTALVDWGDGTVEAGTVSEVNGSFAVSVPNSLHSYADEGDYTATVSVTRTADGLTRTGSGTIAVAEGDVLKALPVSLFVDPDKTVAGTVAFFSDTLASPPGDFTATIDWGDGATATGVVSLVNGTLVVSGTHTYAAVGVDPVDVTLTENAPGMATATSSATAYVGAVVTVGFIGSPALITTEGTPFGGQIATFRSSNLLDTTASYTATIDWGDGTTTPGTISGGNGSFFVSAPGFQHIYADEGAYDATVTVTRGADHTSSTAAGKITVLDADTLSAVIPVQAVDTSLGQPFNAVATFIDTPSVSSPLSQLSPASDFTATIDWGDGTTSSGIVSGGGSGFGSGQAETFTVSGSHTYTTADRHFFTVTLTDDAPGGTTATSSGTVYVGATLGILVDSTAGTAPPPVEHHLFSGQVATFTSTNPLDTAASYSAVIDWGDGTSAGTITQGNGDFIVSGQHTYLDDGDYPMKVTVVRTADGTASTGSSASPIRVGDDDVLTADPPVLLSANPQFSGFVATFADSDTVSQQSDFIASIDWGDGTSTMGGVSRAGGTLAVSGSHTYAATGQYKVTATLGDDDGGGAGGRPGVLVTTMVVETLSVALSGSAREGSTLIATPTLSGNISGSAADVTYQWMRGGSAIAGATGATYQLTEADELTHVTVQAFFTDAGTGQALSATSNPSGLIVDPPPTLSVSILGTAQETQTLQAIAVASSGDAVITYQWQQLNGATWVNIPHATGATYKVVESNENHQLRVLARSSDPDSGNASATSTPTAAVVDVTPSISVTVGGAAQEGQLLSATAIVTSDGDGGHTTYQWQALIGSSWVDIGGATNASFRATEPVEGHELRVMATFTDDTGQSVSTTSDPTAPVVDPTPTLSLTVTGIAQEGRTLTAHPHITSDADGGTTTFQWQRLIGSTWTDIIGAQASTYQVTEADEGFELRATAVFTDDTRQTAAAASAATTAVIDIAPTLSVSISGTAQDGQTLVASATANDADVSISYQWQQLISGTWTDIAGATASSYLVDETNEGRRLRVSGTSADPDGGGITVNSAATAPVIDPPPTLTIAGSSLFVAAGGSVALPIIVTGFDADDQVSVTIDGLPTFETITDALDRRTFAGASVSLTAAEVNSGLTLHSRYTGNGQPVDVLTVTATTTTAGESSKSIPQSIVVTDPPLANGAAASIDGNFNNANLSGAGGNPGPQVNTESTETPGPRGDNFTIGGSNELELFGASTANAAFAPGNDGILWHDASSRFNGVVAGLAPGPSLDLADITFGRDAPLVYMPNGDNTAGTLSASDESHNPNSALPGPYMASSLVLAADGHGGTLIADPPSSQTQILSQSHR